MKTNYRLLFAISCIAVFASIQSCKKDSGGATNPVVVLPFNFQLTFGANATPITVDSSNTVLRNLPRTCSNIKNIVVAAVLPSGYTISPDPATIKDYSTAVNFTLKSGQGVSYTVKVTAVPYDSLANPYGVYTVKDLNDIRNGRSGSYVVMNDINLPDLNSSGVSASNISDYGSYGWYSIGSQYVNGGNVIFRGVFNGQNHTISNLSIGYRGQTNSQPNGIDSGHQYESTAGLFGYASNAILKNVTIQLAVAGINGLSIDSLSGFGPVGALVGRADTCTIANCKVAGMNTGIRAFINGGGLIGNASSCTISKCSAALTHSTGNYAVFANSNVGGLVGRAGLSTISDCYAACDVLGATTVGGLIGELNSSSIQTSYASGNVVEIPYNGAASLIAPNFLGGLVGEISCFSPNNVVVKNSFATGNVAGANGTNSTFHQGTRLGGLIGQISPTYMGTVTVSYCYASGAVTRVWANTATPYLIGGLVGSTSNNIFVTGGTTSTNYWDKTTTTQTNLGGGNTTIAQDNGFTINGKISSDMKNAATYTGWDFTSVWNISSSTNNGYPYLRSTN